MSNNKLVLKTNLTLLCVAAGLGLAVLSAHVAQVRAEDANPPGWLPGSPDDTNNCEPEITMDRECEPGTTVKWLGPYDNCKSSATYPGSDGLTYWWCCSYNLWHHECETRGPDGTFYGSTQWLQGVPQERESQLHLQRVW